jgi:tetratricopeptide (TPR) repeat protein
VAVIHALPADLAVFAGREAELGKVLRALPRSPAPDGVVGISAIGGMAGVGKTAFAVRLAYQLAPQFPDRQFFIRLHGHTPGRRPVQPADALARLLSATGMAPEKIPEDTEARSGLWRSRMAGQKILLILDDAVSSDQVRPLLPATGALVLVTSRRRLTALPEALAVTLDVLKPGEAAQMLTRLAGRPDLQRGDDAAFDVVRLCGYLPLAVAMMAGQLKHHLAWSAADLAADLESAVDRNRLLRTENFSVAASFALSYQNLSAEQQQFFRHLGLHPGADIDAHAAAALNGSEAAASRQMLDELFGYHLIDEPTRGRYRLHDLVREYARELSAIGQPAQREAAVDRLLDYYLRTAYDAGRRYLPRRTPADPRTVPGPPPECAPRLATYQAAFSWLAAERWNLHAAAGFAAEHRLLRYAIAIPAALRGFLRVQGDNDPALAMYRRTLEVAREAGDELAQAEALTDLSDIQCSKGDFEAAGMSLRQALALYRECGNRLGEATALHYLAAVQYMTADCPSALANLAEALQVYSSLDEQLGQAGALNILGGVQYMTGKYTAAVASQQQSLDLYRNLGHATGEVTALCDLGLVQWGSSDYPQAKTNLTHALELSRTLGNRKGEANALNYLGGVQCSLGDYKAAAATQEQALRLYRELGDIYGQANVLNELGIIQRETADYPAAAASLAQALTLYQQAGDPIGEAIAHNSLGAAQHAAGQHEMAAASLTRALMLYRQADDQIGEAEALNNMGALNLSAGAIADARACHERALALTAGISPPEEAQALEGLGRCDLEAGQLKQGTALLRRALSIYKQIRSPQFRQVEITLSEQEDPQTPHKLRISPTLDSSCRPDLCLLPHAEQSFRCFRGVRSGFGLLNRGWGGAGGGPACGGP